MRRVAGLLALLAVAKPQLLWIERSGEREKPPLLAQAYCVSPQEWVIVAELDLAPWLPYAFDTLLPVRVQLATEEGTFAETTLALPPISKWKGYWRWYLPGAPRQSWVALYAESPDAPEGPWFTRLRWPQKPLPLWVESASPHLSLPVRLHEIGKSWIELSPSDSAWKRFFTPALVDTALPLPPYVQKRPRSQIVPCPCAWYLREDTTRVWWTCAWPHRTYPAPGGSLPPPPENRWEESFLQFSDRKPGDRSDRGLLYLFYGPPPVRLLTLQSEVWVYPDANASFHFVYEEGTWRLLRRLEYQGLWKK